MKDIIKIFGLPKTGTNLIEKLLALNIENYVCQHGDYHPNYHYLGWKHGKPKNLQVYDEIVKHTQERVYFIFMIRKFKEWEHSYFVNHYNSWEFPPYYFDLGVSTFVYNTPSGPEIYKNIEDLYITYNTEYKNFVLQNPERSVILEFEDLQKDQAKTVEKVIQKFNFKKLHPYIYEIRKKIDSGGRFNELFI